MGRKRVPRATNYDIENLLKNHIFNIPEYQRCYSWGRKELYDLFNDISDNIEKKEKVFMSTIVTLFTQRILIGTEPYECVDIVDGQQRITTLVILLKAIWLVKKEKGDIDSAIDDLLIKKGDSLTHNVLSQGKHISSIILSNYITSGDRFPNDISTAAQKNVKIAFDECYRFVKYEDYKEKQPHQERNITVIDAIKDIVLHKYTLVYYELPEEKEVYKTFELLNSRGLPVSAIDNLKSQIMGIAFAAKDTSVADELHIIWTDIYNTIGNETIVEDDILSISATLYKALDDTKARPKSVNDAMEYFHDVATKTIAASKVPSVLRHSDTSLDTVGFRCKKISELIKKTASEMVYIHTDKKIDAITDVKHARILLLAIRLSKYSENEKESLLEKWEKTTFRLFCLHRKDARSFVGEYIDCANDLMETKPSPEVIKKIEQIGSKYTFEDGLNNVKGSAWYPYYNNDVIYIMRRYDEALAKEAGTSISTKVWNAIWASDPSTTIEHIFPKTYPKNQTQITNFKKDWAHGGRQFSQKKLDGFVNNIGNLTILEPGLNSQAGQKPFAEKTKIYGDTMRIHPKANSKYLKNGFWVEDSIKEREEDILNFIRTEWS